MLKTQFINQKHVVSILVILLIAFAHLTSYAAVTPVTDRTPQVRDAIVAAVPGINTASDVTETHLAAITALDLRAAGISALKTGDFSGLTGLTNLNLYGNDLSSLPDGIFEGLTALTTLRLGGNTVDPMPITVSLEKVGDNQFKTVAPTGAPFDIVLPLSAMNGSIGGDAVSVTISKGSPESSALTVSRTAETTAAVTVDVGTLPSLPANHYGYVLSKSDALPLEVIGEITTTPVDPPVVPDPDPPVIPDPDPPVVPDPDPPVVPDPDPPVVPDPDPPVVPDPDPPVVPDPDPPTPTNTAPMFSEGAITTRIVAENTAAGVNIGSAVAATDVNNDTLTYTLTGADAGSFSIDSNSGQLTTKAALDYETKRVYSVSITVSDGNLTDTIRVIISIIDTADTPLVSMSLSVSERTPQVHDAIIAAVPGVSSANNVTDAHLAAITSLNLRGAGISALKTGDFSGLTGLTSLNLYNNMLSSLPNGIFEGLTALTSLRLGGNLVDPMPLIVSLQQVDANQFQAVIPTGAPFNVVLPVSAMMVTIPKGSFTSAPFTVVDMATVNIDALPSLPANHFGYAFSKSTVCNRTPEVAEAIAAAVPDVTDCANVTEVDLATITTLNLSSMSITALKSDDFSGMLSLTTLNLSNNILSSLPDGIFDDLPSLTTLDLSGNSVSPFPFTVSLQKVGENMLKTVVPTGAPFDIAVPVIIKTGNTLTGTINLTIPQGSRESQLGTVTRTAGTTAAVTADIGTLPSLPATHTGYALVKTNQQPLEIFRRINVAPVFTAGVSATRSIAENTAAGTNIGEPISATDADNDTLAYSLGGTDASAFAIDTKSGQLKTNAALDYETRNSYSVAITVSDGKRTDTISVTISVTDIDEKPVTDDSVTTKDPTPTNNAPVFTAGESATRSIAENTGAGVDIGSAFSATDADNDTLKYSLGGTDAASFSIDSTTGQLRTSAALDYGTKTSYSVTITVSDGSLTDTISVTIAVTDVDETPANTAPMFTDGDNTTRTVAENTGSGVDIGTAVSANDTDNDALTYSLSGTDAASFSIDSTTGQLRTSAALDYETKTSYTVTITVSDGNGGTDTITVTVNITDVDEAPSNTAPVFTAGNSTTRSIAENTGAGVDIGSAVSATDADNDTLKYSLGGTDAAAFSIDSSSGQLRTSAALDYENKSSYTVTVIASDGTLTDSITVTINVTNVNEAPVFADGNSTTRAIAENVPADINIGSVVAATDPEGSKLTYTLGGTDAASFSIDAATGQLRTSAALDYEKKNTYSVTIAVSDDNGGTDTITVAISVTDLDEVRSNNAPAFTEGDSTTRSIAENSTSGTNIGAVIDAKDADNNTLAYLLSGADASAFSIDSTTGQLKTSAPLDFETKAAYTVTVTVSDGSGTDSITVTINVTDVNEAPVIADSADTTLSIAENTAAGVNIGGTFSATDPDGGDTLTYSLGGTDASAFSIDSSSGQLRTSTALDYERKTSYSVTITVSDGSLTDTITVTINVTDVNEAPIISDSADTTLSIAENTAAGVNIDGTFSATDPDDGDTLTYSLGGTDASSFGINSSSGQLRTSAALDYESKSSYTVTVIASDGTLTDSITVTINVTNVNEAPVFADGNSTTRAIAENVPADINIGSAVSATDPDGSKLTYTLGGTDAASFSIDGATGQLKTQAKLNYETKTSYSVTITVSDGSRTDTITVTINVTNLDETPTNNAPVFTDGTSTTRSIAENSTSGTNIGAVIAATDVDNNTLAYLLSGDEASAFSIDSTTGQLKTSAPLDFETKAAYTVTVTVVDGSLTDTITVTINVTDVNEAPVIADSADTTLSIAENTAAGMNIDGTFSATDPDDGDTLTYSLGGTDASAFGINSTSGQLRTSAALDYESKTSYSVTITVSDGSLTDSISITISVTNVNEVPVFSDGVSTTRAIAENVPADINIGSVVAATDPEGSKLTYTLGGTDAASFSIDGATGQLKTSAPLDFETKAAYTVTVTVSDGSRTDSITVTINITDVNEAPVIADSADTTLSIAENTAAGVNIGGTFSATDPDDGDTLTWTLGGTDAASFSINSTNGQLRTQAALNFERKTSYSVTITVSDGSLTDTISVTINIDDVDENRAPVFTAGNSATRSIAENTGSGVNIGTAVSANDPDNDTLEYTLGGTDASAFSINSTNGQLRTQTALNYEKKTSYSVTITVSDGKLTDTIAVTINIDDVDENRAPVFTEGDSATRFIAENTGSGVDIGSAVSATDADNDTLEYSLGGTDAGSFSINSTNGQLRTSAALDYDKKTSYSVTINVSDGRLTDTINVTIDVTDVDDNHAPVFTDGESTTRAIDENTGSGVNIGGAVSATDADNDTLEYSLGGTDAGSFSINSTNGQLRTNAALNYEKKTSYSVTITVSDGNGGTDSITVTINVTNVNEAPVFADGDSITRSVAENVPVDTVVARLSVTDPDDNAVGALMSESSLQSDGFFKFKVEFSKIETNKYDVVIKTRALLDYETQRTYELEVGVVDVSVGGNLITVTINVDNVNEAPAFTERNPTREIAENTAVNQEIGSPIVATDPDVAGTNTDTNPDTTDADTLEYSLGGDDAASFGIDSETGQLKTKAALDYEKKTSYSVTITVSDSSLTDTINVTINVTDVDDNHAPVFTDGESTTRVIDENTAADTNIGTPVAATDANNDTLTYTLGGYNAASFDIDSETGHLKTKAWLDYERKNSYTVTITVSDGSLTDSITVTINVNNVNDAPAFAIVSIVVAGSESPPVTRSVAENTAAGENIGTPVAAVDQENDTLTYTLSGDDASSFSIDSETGQLKTKAALDYEEKTSYSVTITVSDGSRTDTITVTINVNNVNDAPVFQYGSSITLSKNKGESVGTSIRATDEDDDTLTYSLSGTDAALFSLDEDYEYYLKSNAALDYDGKTSYSVTITVSDGNGGSDTITVTITDAAPEVEIWTLIRREEPDWVLKLDTETGIVRASLSGLFVTSLFKHNSISFTRPPGVQFDNFFEVSVVFQEEVSGFEQSELTLTDNTAGATIGSWQSQETWLGFVYSTDVYVTMSGSVTFNVAAGVATDNAGQPNPVAESKTVTVTIELTDYPPWDVNEDGSVDATDSALVTAALGQTGEDIVNSRTDVNWDDTVDADDVTLVTYHIVDEEAAPSIIRAFSLLDKKTLEKLDPVTLQGYLDILRTESDGSPRYLRAIALLESVLASIRPSKTQLLANYPNPFNPETWIPYHLANPSNVRISIYNMQGVVVRRLELGHQPAGYYTNRSRAAYWDGTNEIGERVSSGVYFYQLQADNVSLLRKMLILK